MINWERRYAYKKVTLQEETLFGDVLGFTDTIRQIQYAWAVVKKHDKTFDEIKRILIWKFGKDLLEEKHWKAIQDKLVELKKKHIL